MNTITNPELEHLGVGPHVIQEFQPLDNAVVEINQFSFGEPVDVDPHDSSKSHRYAAALNIRNWLETSRLQRQVDHAVTPFVLLADRNY